LFAPHGAERRLKDDARVAMTGWGYENSFPWNSKYIWELGYQSGQWDQAADPKVLSTVLRGGNFDYVTNMVHRESITPQTIPNSLYLSAKPARHSLRSAAR
jgi:hypothetical protein